jgi:hypothetical protein
VDQVMSWRSCRAKSRRWTMTVLYYILDTTRVNCATVRKLQEKAKKEADPEYKEQEINQVNYIQSKGQSRVILNANRMRM